MLLWWVLSAWAEPTVTTRDLTGHRVAALQRADHPSDMVVVYAAEQYGSIGPCGCNDYPMGGMARVERYAERLAKREATSAVLKLYAGGAFLPARAAGEIRVLSGQLHPNEAMARVLERGAWDAVNITCGDLHADAPWAFPSGSLSTNLLGLDGELPRHRVIERNGISTLVLGVTGTCGDQNQRGVRVSDPLHAVQTALAARGEAIDRVVVLTHRVGETVSAIARLEGVDVVIEADGYTARYPPVFASGQAVWVRTWREAERLGELRLDWDNNGRLLRAEDGAIGLAPGLRGMAWVERLVDEVATSSGPG